MADKLGLIDLSEYPKRVELTDGREIWLRPLRPDDRDRMHRFFVELPARDRRYLKHDVTQREVINNWCENIDYDYVLPILAIVKENGRELIKGVATLHTDRHGWSTHVARIRFSIHPEMRKLGLGKVFLRELLDRAMQRGIQKLQAELREDNQDAISLLKRIGFKKEAVFKKHVMDLQGRYHDMVIFYHDLSDLWNRMEDLNIDLDFNVVP